MCFTAGVISSVRPTTAPPGPLPVGGQTALDQARQGRATASPVGIDLSQQALGKSFAGSGGNIKQALQKNVNEVAEQIGTSSARKKVAAKSKSTSQNSTLLTSTSGLAKKTLLGT